MTSPRVTLKDIARTAGVSVGTVSQALRNDSNSSRATCERIQEIARTMGYRPDPLMAALSSRNRRRDIKLDRAPIVYATCRGPEQDWDQLRYHNALKASVESLGYAFAHERIESEKNLRQALHRWYHQGVRGIAYCLFTEVEWIHANELSDFSVIMLGALWQRPIMHTVRPDSALALQLAINKALEAGFQRIGLAMALHPQTGLLEDEIRVGLTKVALSGPHADRFINPLWCWFREEYSAATERCRQWFEAEQPDVVIGFPITHGHLSQTGALAHTQFITCSQSSHSPGYTGCNEQDEVVAMRGAQWLDTMIRHSERGLPEQPFVISVPVRWETAPDWSQSSAR